MMSVFIGVQSETILETLPTLQHTAGPFAFWLARVVFEGAFTAEALLRLWCAPAAHRNPMAGSLVWLDVLTIIPFWARVIAAPASLTPTGYFSRPSAHDVEYVLGMLDSLATFRLLKLARYYDGAELLRPSAPVAFNQLLVSLFFLFM